MAVIKKSWMTEDMYQAWLGYLADAGGPDVVGAYDVAIRAFRDDSRYATEWFPGIKREDGTIRYQQEPELTYSQNMEDFKQVVDGMQLNRDIFTEDYIALIEGDVSPVEFQSRMNALDERVGQQGAAIREWYAANAGVDMTREGILASLMSERVEESIFNREITMAEIGGTFASREFDLNREFVEMLVNEGMNRDEAQRFAGSGERMVPLLGALARRQGDNTDWSIESFIETAYMDDPEGLADIQRLYSAEESTFTGGAQVEVARGPRLGLTGLEAS